MLPRIERRASATQLIVGDEPFLILGGELANSSASHLAYLEPIWPRLVELNLNTVLLPVYWELFEPSEGEFDFRLLEGALAGARGHGLKLVLLWFGSFKNSMSCYAPAWVKRAPERFPRVELSSGKRVEMLTAFSAENLAADVRAFTRLMSGLRELDAERRTVLMVQVENEVGMLEDARDFSAPARAAHAEPVAAELLAELARARAAGTLSPELTGVWGQRGFRAQGSFSEVFGDEPEGDEVFTAFHYARYVNAVARAGKAVYPLPMFTNAALNRPGKRPGEYPAGGPLPHLLPVWRAGAPDLDFLSPDIYYGSFADWCARYARSDNALFIPEADRAPASAVRAFYAFGEHAALGFSPFSVDSIESPAQAPLSKAYGVLRGLAPALLRAQAEGKVRGVLLDHEKPRETLTFGELVLEVSHDYTWEWSARPRDAVTWPEAGAAVLELASDEFLVAGSGVIVTFRSSSAREIGILAVDEGRFDDAGFVPGRRLNGDEDHQGRHLRIAVGDFAVQRARLYSF